MIIILFFLLHFHSLVGAIFFSSLGLLVPAVVEIVFLSSYEGFGKLNWRLWKNVFLAIFSVIAMCAGTLVSVIDIIETYTGHEILNSTTTTTESIFH